MAKRDSTGTMADVPAAGPTFSSSLLPCFWFSLASGLTPRLWPTEDMVVWLVRMSFWSEDSKSAGRVDGWVDCRVSGRYIWVGVLVSERALSVGSGTWVLREGKCLWRAILLV